MARSVPDSLIGIRDRAILLLGFAGALRRSGWWRWMLPIRAIG